MKTYRYILSLNDASPTIAYPIREDDQAYDYTKENEQVFFRKKLTGPSLIFCNDDFDIINNAAFTTKFGIEIFILNEFDLYVSDFIGVFYKTDCDFDDDRKQLTVQPDPIDNYKKVIEGMDREFNLIDLAPTTVELDYVLQPLFQVYIPGSNIITNVLSGNSFEQDVTTPVTSGTDLLLTYFFAPFGIYGNVMLPDTGLNPDVSGEYVDEQGLVWNDPGFSDPSKGFLRKSDGAYRIRLENLFDPESDMIIEEVSTGTTLYRGPKTAGQDYDTITYTSLLSGDTTKFIFRTFWGRFLTNQDDVDGTPTDPIPDVDIIPTSSQYSRVLRLGKDGLTPTYGDPLQDAIIASSGHSTTPTRYDKFDSSADFFAGQYFIKPTGLGTGAIYPLGQSNWNQVSFWWQYNDYARDFQESGAETKTQYNAYKLVDVIQSVLTALDTGLTFDETTDCSQFFFDPANPIRTIDATPVIVPKSNIISGEYGTPAKRAPIRLSYLLALLWGAYKCKWHVDSLDFVVENAEYYHKGTSYTTNVIGADLTTLTEAKTGKAWSYKTNKWKYDKSQIPGQIRIAWMENTSEVFDGFPIDIRSLFADQGSIEEITIPFFTSDIDYIQLAPDNVSKDGFFFGEAETVGGRLTLPFVTLDLGNVGEYKVQNGYAAMVYLQNQYHKYVLPAEDITLNLEDTTAESVKRTKLQEFKGDEALPSDVLSGDTLMQLVTTNLGTGQVRSYTDKTNGGGSELVIEHDI